MGRGSYPTSTVVLGIGFANPSGGTGAKDSVFMGLCKKNVYI